MGWSRKVRDLNTQHLFSLRFIIKILSGGFTVKTRWRNRLDTTDWPTKAIHMSDINDLGKVVAPVRFAAWKKRDWKWHFINNCHRVGIVSILLLRHYKANGEILIFLQVPVGVSAFWRTKGIAEMFGYFEAHLHGAWFRSHGSNWQKAFTTGELCRSRECGWCKTIKQMKPSWATTQKKQNEYSSWWEANAPFESQGCI